MRVLVTWGTREQGTAGIAHTIADELRVADIDVTTRAARLVKRVSRYDAVIIGGGLYANRWQRDARRFVQLHAPQLLRVPVWFFSSGPLDDSAERNAIPPTRQVKSLMDRVGARGHATFGGRLLPNARGFIAKAMAREKAGDWRNEEQIRAWSRELAEGLSLATPGVPVKHAAHSLARLLRHGIIGWAACAVLLGGLISFASTSRALLIHGIAMPIVFAGVSWHYFARPGAREPAQVAFAFTAIVALLDFVVVASEILGSEVLVANAIGIWLPVTLVFVATYFMGLLISTWPSPSGAPSSQASIHAEA